MESPAPTRLPHARAAGAGMIRTLLGVAMGYFAFAATLAIGVALMLVMLTHDTLFAPGTWRLNTGPELVLVLLGGLGALMGGAVCRPIGGSPRVIFTFAATLLVTVAVWQILRANGPAAGAVRGANETASVAAAHIEFGPFMQFALPVVAALCAYAGGRLANKVQRGLVGT